MDTYSTQFDLVIANELDPEIFITQPGCTAETTISDLIACGGTLWGNATDGLGLNMTTALRFFKAKSTEKEKGYPNRVALISKSGDVRDMSLEELGFFSDKYDTLLVGDDSGNGADV